MKKIHLKSIFSNRIFRLIIVLSLPLVILSSIFIYQNITYNNILNKFKANFDSFQYPTANNISLTEGKFNIFKILSFETDLSSYFNKKLEEVSDSIKSNKIDDNQAISILNEINRYNLNNATVLNCFSLLDKDVLFQDTYNQAINLHKDGKFEESLDKLSKIPSSSPNYSLSQYYIKLNKDGLKKNIFATADEYVKNDYYTKALDYLNSYNKLFGDDVEFSDKKTSINESKTDYLSKNNSSKPVSSNTESIVNNITSANINNLNIGSFTNYLLYVSLDEQKTYLYKGSVNKWNLEKTMLCSTGIEGKDTPTGVYEIGEKGDWFYSEKFDQGGKYWLQFYGNDYLFHSLPFKEDKTTVDDWTLGKKASHGCIRLPIEDSKWLFNNIPRGTKVIIK
ncbi:MAG: L,D-transpeptidase [Clostridium sp.]